MIDRLNATYSKFILETQLNSRNGSAAAAVAGATARATSNRTGNGRGRERERSSTASVSIPNTVPTPVNREQANAIKLGA